LSSAIRGTVLAGRYRLEERVHSNPDGATWRALDTALDRRVSVYVMRPGHPFAADVADAARRAALVDDPRLVRVLNVGVDDDLNFVVSEFVDGDTLGSLVERSPLTPAAARRVVGEVAEGLDGAAKRGLHHLRLTPRSVVVGRDGRVKIFGTAVEAAAAGLEPAHASRAQRIDATGLIALLYSGLTGRWPLGDAGFPPAPRGENGGPVPPATLVRGVPDDLNQLCVATLGSVNDGPRSPSELVLELSPWPSAQEAPVRAVSGARPAAPAPNPTTAGAGRPAGATAAPATGDQPLAVRTRGAAGPKPKGRAATPAAPPTGSLFAPQPPMPPTGPITPARGARRPGTPARGVERPTAHGAGSPAGPTSPGGPGTAAAPGVPGADVAGNGRGPFAPSARPTVPPAPPATSVPRSTAIPSGSSPNPTTPTTPTTPATPATPATPPAAPAARAGDTARLPDPAVTSVEPESDDDVFHTPPVVPGYPSSTARSATPPRPNGKGPNPKGGRSAPRGKAGPRTPRNGTRQPSHAAGPGTRPSATEAPRTTRNRPASGRAARATGARTEEQLLPWSPGWQQGATPPSGLESTGGFPIVIPSESPPSEQSRLVLFAVAAVLLLGLVFAGFSLRNFGDNSRDLIPGDASTPLPATTTAPPAAEPTTEAAAVPTPSATPTTTKASAPVRIDSVRAIDPQGDGDENSADANNVLAGQGGTWKSQTYFGADFGGLKDGVGLVFKLKQKAAVAKATITFEGSGGSVELRTAPGPDYAGSKVVGKSALNGGSATVKAKKPVASKYVILWFTELPSVSGSYRIEISEVRLQ
jgi:hypothetical protein